MGTYEKRLKEDLGVEHHRIEGGQEPGRGDGLRFLTPNGMPSELYGYIERYAAPQVSISASG